jgi:DNA polymerase II small subunit/DNA polymerase delta subunit B
VALPAFWTANSRDCVMMLEDGCGGVRRREHYFCDRTEHLRRPLKKKKKKKMKKKKKKKKKRGGGGGGGGGGRRR